MTGVEPAIIRLPMPVTSLSGSHPDINWCERRVSNPFLWIFSPAQSPDLPLSHGGKWWSRTTRVTMTADLQSAPLPLRYNFPFCSSNRIRTCNLDYIRVLLSPLSYGTIQKTILHAVKDSNPDQEIWSHLCYRYTNDVYMWERRDSNPHGFRDRFTVCWANQLLNSPIYCSHGRTRTYYPRLNRP